MVIGLLAAVLAGYLLGSIQVAPRVAGRHGVDLRRHGDGNPGAWNALEALGARRAWPAFAGDGAKALAAGLIGRELGGWWVGWAAVAAAMVGHALPIFARGRGGKSVMCFAGGALALSPVAAAPCLGAFLLLAAVRRGAAGALIGAFAFPAVQLATDPVAHVGGSGVLMTLIGLLFLVRRRTPAPASSAPGGPPTA
jgi:glycerol-3-phosphate acyltransferase PlsY